MSRIIEQKLLIAQLECLEDVIYFFAKKFLKNKNYKIALQTRSQILKLKYLLEDLK